MVILPDHLHALWTLPVDDRDDPLRWMPIKAGFSRQLPKGTRLSESRITNGDRGSGWRGLTGQLLRTNRYTNCDREHIHHNIEATIWVVPVATQPCC